MSYQCCVEGCPANHVSKHEVCTVSSNLRSTLENILAQFKGADEERLRNQLEWREEWRKWKAEGDMYGCNFHQGMDAGANWVSLYFFRVQRELEALIKQAPVETPQRAETPECVVCADKEHRPAPREYVCDRCCDLIHAEREVRTLRAEKATLQQLLDSTRRSVETNGGVDAFTWALAQKQLDRLVSLEEERARYRTALEGLHTKLGAQRNIQRPELIADIEAALDSSPEEPEDDDCTDCYSTGDEIGWNPHSEHWCACARGLKAAREHAPENGSRDE